MSLDAAIGEALALQATGRTIRILDARDVQLWPPETW
jgi:hypothetical protein